MSVSTVMSPSQAVGTTSTPSPRARTRREAILESALEIIAREGFHRASVAEIASRAHVSRATVYQHFADKRDILRALADRSEERRVGKESRRGWAAEQ